MAESPDFNPTTPGAHLALDLSLFQTVEATGRGEVLRVWEVNAPAVVVGHGDDLQTTVYLERCVADAVPVLRRTTGGGAVVLGAGCLNITLVLSLDCRPELRDVAHSYHVILSEFVAALGIPGLSRRGQSDLALGDRKVSGNAQRRGRRTLLHQGTLLCGVDVSLMSRYLREPTRQPAYRARRSHDAFVTALPITTAVAASRLHAGCAALPASFTSRSGLGLRVAPTATQV